MNDLQISNYGTQEVRTFLIDENPWWVLADVCRVPGLTTPSRVADRLDIDEKMTMSLAQCHSNLRGGVKKLIVINEPGLYSVIIRFDKSEAKAFK